MMTNTQEVWELFSPEKPFSREIRAFHHTDKRRVKSKVFRPALYKGKADFKQAIEQYAAELNDQGFNVYFSLNPIKQSFEGASASDDDILQYEFLLIDLDRAGDTKNPATDKEIEMATLLGDAILEFLTALGWPQPTRVMSGNGHHLYYRLDDLPNDPESKRLIRQVLNCLADKFNTKDFEVDRVVFNSSRITKFPGTIMRKGVESDDRPYRRAAVHGN
jgi:hypothetical protein